MFSSSSKKESTDSHYSPGSAGSANSINSIGLGTYIEGKIKAENDIRIDGELKGSLECKGKVIIGPKGKLNGDITCKNAVIEGTFTGELSVNELLSVKDSAKIDGEINTGQLIVQSGAVFNVSCTMGGKKVTTPAQNGKGQAITEHTKV